jgi:sugar lactone lactonase YvrE
MDARMRKWILVVIAVAALCALPASAAAYTTTQGYLAQDYATGLPESATNHWGPIGLAFDQSDNLYVADTQDGNIYRFQPGGGSASAATRLTQTPIPGKLSGLAIAPSGAIYLARYQPGDVVQIDPGTGQIIRTVANVPCATGVAIDPISGDMFVSENQCGSTIYRVSNYASGAGTVTSYANLPGVDGLVFADDGTLYAESDGQITRVAGTNSPTPGAVTGTVNVPTADGVAIGAPIAGQSPFLVANRNDGTVTRVDFSAAGAASETNIFTGGSRGDFVAVDSHGCLYITQASSIVRITGANGSCTLQPTTQGAAQPQAIVANVSSVSAASTQRACVLMSSLRVRARQQGRVRLKTVTVYIKGRRVKRLTGSAVTGTITLSKLPHTSFTLKIVAITMKGKKLITRRWVSNCQARAARVVRRHRAHKRIWRRKVSPTFTG